MFWFLFLRKSFRSHFYITIFFHSFQIHSFHCLVPNSFALQVFLYYSSSFLYRIVLVVASPGNFQIIFSRLYLFPAFPITFLLLCPIFCAKFLCVASPHLLLFFISLSVCFSCFSFQIASSHIFSSLPFSVLSNSNPSILFYLELNSFLLQALLYCFSLFLYRFFDFCFFGDHLDHIITSLSFFILSNSIPSVVFYLVPNSFMLQVFLYCSYSFLYRIVLVAASPGIFQIILPHLYLYTPFSIPIISFHSIPSKFFYLVSPTLLPFFVSSCVCLGCCSFIVPPSHYFTSLPIFILSKWPRYCIFLP